MGGRWDGQGIEDGEEEERELNSERKSSIPQKNMLSDIGNYRPGLAKGSSQARFSCFPGFVNKVLLAHSHGH